MYPIIIIRPVEPQDDDDDNHEVEEEEEEQEEDYDQDVVEPQDHQEDDDDDDDDDEEDEEEEDEDVVVVEPQNNEDIIVEVPITLEEMATGVSKNIIFNRLVDGRPEEVPLTIHFDKGWNRKQHNIRLMRYGDRYPGKTPANVIFVPKEIPHPLFQRIPASPDLLYKMKISLREALCQRRFEIPPFGSRRTPLNLILEENETMPNNYVRVFENYGLPHQEAEKGGGAGRRRRGGGGGGGGDKISAETCGNLWVKFEIDFPKHLTNEQREQLEKIL